MIIFKLWSHFKLIFAQIRSIILLFYVSIKHKSDFIIIDAYSFKNATKIGEFTFKPRVFFYISLICGLLIMISTVLILHFSPLGFHLLSQKDHPMENEFIEIAQRLQNVTDSLETNMIQFNLIKEVIRSSSDTTFRVSSHLESIHNEILKNEMNSFLVYSNESSSNFANNVYKETNNLFLKSTKSSFMELFDFPSKQVPFSSSSMEDISPNLSPSQNMN